MRTIAKPRLSAFTLVELLVSMAVVGVLVMLFLPTLMPARRRPSHVRAQLQCQINLKQIGLAFRIWEGDHNDQFPMQVSVTNGGTREFVLTGLVFPHFLVMSNELNTPKLLRCPVDMERTNAVSFTSDFNDWKLSYFVNLEANGTAPQGVLGGDRNLTLNGVPAPRGLVPLSRRATLGWFTNLHVGKGNLLFADGSVQQVGTARLSKVIAGSGVATNRLAIP